MDKNTIWAIVLSTLVLFAALFIQEAFIAPKQQAKAAEEEQNIALAEENFQEESTEALDSFFVSDENDHVAETSAEEFITVKTDLIEAVLTTKGGDVVSYKLLKHNDHDTNEGVQMVDNVTDTNRAFALSFGGNNSNIINDIFNVHTEDDGKTIIFYKDYVTKDSQGNETKLRIGKRYSFKDGDYVFKLDIIADTGSAGNRLDLDGVAYTLRTSPQIGPHYDRKKDRYEVREYVAYNGSKRVRKNISNKVYDKDYTWAGVAGKYFTILVMPENMFVMNDTVTTSTKSSNDYENAQVFLSRKAMEQNKINDSYYVYVGPRSETELIKYNNSSKNEWGLNTAKFNQALSNSGFLSFIEIGLKWCLEKIYMLVHNWGLSIIILTILLKLCLFPLNKSQAEGSVKMQALQPKMQALQEKYKDNPTKLQEETSKLYKEAGYNPASGCLPLILQMIILLAMYRVFNNYFEFRGTSFIPGWIDDLSRGDSVLSWDKQIPIISGLTQNNLRPLPFIYLASQLLNGKITQYGGAAAGNAQSKAQMNMMLYAMPILFFFMFYNVPSGLLLYWTVSNIFQMGQQFIINKTTKGKREALEKSVKPMNKNEAKFNGF